MTYYRIFGVNQYPKFFLALVALVVSATLRADLIESIPPGHWIEIKNSKLRQVAPCGGVSRNAKIKPNCIPSNGDPDIDCYNSYALKDISHIVWGWNGAAFDEKRQALLIFGGGHKGWGGNEIYSFSLETLKWERINNPSCLTLNDARLNISGRKTPAYYSDNTPRSFHSYNSIQYVRHFDSMCRFGSGENSVDCFDLSNRKWFRVSDIPISGVGTISSVDNITGIIWVRTNEKRAYLLSYNPKDDKWIIVNKKDGHKFLYNWTAAINPQDKLMLAVGGKRTLSATYLWDLKNQSVSIKKLNTNGDNEVEKSQNPGLQYDPSINAFVAWHGGSDIFVFDINSKRWMRHSASIGNKIDPGAQAKNGTYGRFRYSKKYDVYILMNGVDSNIYLYRTDKDSIRKKLLKYVR